MGKIQVTSPTDVGLTVKEAAAQTANSIEVQDNLGNVLWYVGADGSMGSATGDVVGPASSTDNAIARFNGTGGKDIQNSVVTVADTTGTISINGHAAISDPTATPTGKYLKDDGTWASVSGTGDFVGPGASTDHAVVRFDGITGKLGQNSLVTMDDAGSVNIPTGQSYKINSVALSYTDVGAAASGTGVTNGDSHDHSGGDGAQINHTTLSNIGTNAHSAIDTAISNSTSHISAASPHSSHAIGIASTTDNRVVRFDSTGGKQLQDSLMTIDDSGSPNIPSGQTYNINGSAHSHTGLVTNGDSHDHSGGDGAQIAHTALSSIGTNTHAQIDTHLASTSNPHSVTKTQVSLGNVTDNAQVKKISSSTDNAILRWDGTSGDLPQDSVVTIADTTGTIAINAHTALTDPTGSPTGKFLRDDGSWQTPTGSGDVVGPASATDNALPRFDTTTGKLIQNSVITVADSTGALSINGHQALTDPTASPTNKFLRDDGTWQTPSTGSLSGPPDEADFIVWNDSGTYKAYDPLTNTVDYSNANFATMMSSLLSGEADEVVIKFRPGTYSVPSSIQIAGASFTGTRLIGSGEQNTIFQATASCGVTGVIDGRATNLQIEGITIDANNQSTTVGVALGAVPGDGYGSYRQSLKDCTILNCTVEALRIRDQSYYYNIDNVRMMDGNVFGVHFHNDTGAAGDNGQTVIRNCEISGTTGCIKATYTAATRHRILIERCGFYDSHSGNYMVDLAGMYDVELNSCDFEGASGGEVGVSFLRVSGGGNLIIGCQFFGRTDFTSAVAITGTDWGSGYWGRPVFIKPSFENWDASCTAFDITSGEFIVIGPEVCAGNEAGFKLFSASSRQKASVFDHTNNPMRARIYDDFIGRALNTFTWNTGNSEAGATVRIEASQRNGICRFSTGSTINTDAILDMDSTFPMTGQYNLFCRFVAKLSSAADVKAFMGIYYDANNYVGFRLDTSVSANWYYVTRVGGVESAGSTGIAAEATAHHVFEVFYDNLIAGSAGYRWFIDSAQTNTSTTNIFNTVGEPRVSIENLAASDKQLDLDEVDCSNRRY